jgi:magnesium transporter
VQYLSTLDQQRIEELLARDEYFWLDLERPGPEQLEQLGRVFGFHKLALEDNSKFDQRPKLDDYGDYVFVVYYGVGPPEESSDPTDPVLVEVHLYISGRYVVTLRHRPCPDLDKLKKAIQQHPPRSEEFLVYRIFDSLTDTFFPVLDGIDNDIDQLEDLLIRAPGEGEVQRIFRLKRQLVMMRQKIAPQRDLFARAMDQIGELPGLQTETRDYFRNVYDHLLRASEQIDSYRDLLSGAMDVYLSTVSNRLNQVMKQLTIISTVFLPLTFVTGFYGQNFRWLVAHVDTFQAFMIFGIGGLVVPLIALFWLFRSRGWL